MLAGWAKRILGSRRHEDAALWILDGNRRARRYYEAMGFAPDGESREVDWEAPLQSVLHAKALKPTGERIS
jgi:RimJ/RimL family protein N-acetyltransferase